MVREGGNRPARTSIKYRPRKLALIVKRKSRYRPTHSTSKRLDPTKYRDCRGSRLNSQIREKTFTAVDFAGVNTKSVEKSEKRGQTRRDAMKRYVALSRDADTFVARINSIQRTVDRYNSSFPESQDRNLNDTRSRFPDRANNARKIIIRALDIREEKQGCLGVVGNTMASCNGGIIGVSNLL